MTENVGAESRQLAGDGRKPLGIATAQNKLGAQTRELKCDRLADPPPRAGHEHDLAGKQAVPECQRHGCEFVVGLSELLGHVDPAVYAVW